jgi:hypothetical protein
MFDDHIAFKIAEELEDWKERQQELFKAKVTYISRYYASDLLILGLFNSAISIAECVSVMSIRRA